MGVEFYNRFNAFCNSFKIRYYEQGYYKGDDWTFENIIAPYNRLYVVLEGSATIFQDNHILHLKKGFAYLIPAGTNFSCTTPVYLEKLYCHFLTDNNPLLDLFHMDTHIINKDITENIDFYKSFHNHLLTDEVKSFYMMKQAYDALIHQFINLYDSKKESSDVLDLTPKIQDLITLIEKNLNANLRVSWLAEQVGMTGSTLSKYYFKHMNRKIKNDITDRLMQKSKIMLLSTEKSIQEIAYALGYTDSLYFSKVFKKNESITPTEYRKQNQIYYR